MAAARARCFDASAARCRSPQGVGATRRQPSCRASMRRAGAQDRLSVSEPHAVVSVSGARGGEHGAHAPSRSVRACPRRKDIALAERGARQGGHPPPQGPALHGVERRRTCSWCFWPGRWRSSRTIILLDEPTSHLDFKNQVHSLRAIGAAGRTGRHHDHDDARSQPCLLFPGRVLLMNPGSAPASDPPLRSSPAPTLVRDLRHRHHVLTVPRRDGCRRNQVLQPVVTLKGR